MVRLEEEEGIVIVILKEEVEVYLMEEEVIVSLKEKEPDRDEEGLDPPDKESQIQPKRRRRGHGSYETRSQSYLEERRKKGEDE